MSIKTDTLEDVKSEDTAVTEHEDNKSDDEYATPVGGASTRTSVEHENADQCSDPGIEESVVSESPSNAQTNRESLADLIARNSSFDENKEDNDIPEPKSQSVTDENFKECTSDLDNSENLVSQNIDEDNKESISNSSRKPSSTVAINSNSSPEKVTDLSKYSTPIAQAAVTEIDNDDKMSSTGSDQMSMVRKISFKKSSLTKHSPIKMSSNSNSPQMSQSSRVSVVKKPSVASSDNLDSITDRTEMSELSSTMTTPDIRVRPSSDITAPIKTAHIKDHRLSTNMWDIISTENPSSLKTSPEKYHSALNSEASEGPIESFYVSAVENENQTFQDVGSESETNRTCDSQMFENLNQSQQSTPKTRFPGQRYRTIRRESVVETDIPEEDEGGEYLLLEEETETQRSTAASPKWALPPPGARLAQNLPPSDFFISKKNEIYSNQLSQEKEKKRMRALRNEQKMKRDANVKHNHQVQKRREKKKNSWQRRVISKNESVLQRFNDIEMRTREQECARSRRRYEEAQRRIEEQRRQQMEERQRRIEENALMLWILDPDVKF